MPVGLRVLGFEGETLSLGFRGKMREIPCSAQALIFGSFNVRVRQGSAANTADLQVLLQGSAGLGA